MEMEELKPELSILRCAADELKSSVKLKSVLAVSYGFDTLGLTLMTVPYWILIARLYSLLGIL